MLFLSLHSSFTHKNTSSMANEHKLAGGNRNVSFDIGPSTRYIISTSGRVSSLRRYKKLLQDELKLDIAYLPIHSMIASEPKIDPEKFVWTLRGLPCIGGAISRDIKESVS
jgi:hypothetical protein